MGVLVYLPKLKCSLLFNILYHKNVPYLILYELTSFQCHTFFFLFKQLMASQTLRFIFDNLLKQCLTRKKRGEDGNIKN